MTLLDESYNANPSSMKAALERLSELSGARKVAILGDMLELGPNELKFHEELLPLVENLDLVLLVGSRMKSLQALLNPRKCMWFQDVNALIKKLPKIIKSRDILLIKGSNSIQLQRVVNELKAKNQELSC